jgi:hypothetical protein
LVAKDNVLRIQVSKCSFNEGLDLEIGRLGCANQELVKFEFFYSLGTNFLDSFYEIDLAFRHDFEMEEVLVAVKCRLYNNFGLQLLEVTKNDRKAFEFGVGGIHAEVSEDLLMDLNIFIDDQEGSRDFSEARIRDEVIELLEFLALKKSSFKIDFVEPLDFPSPFVQLLLSGVK